MTRDNWIAIGIALITIILNNTITIIGWFVAWKNTSRTLQNKELLNRPVQKETSPVLNVQNKSVRFSPISKSYLLTVRISLLIVNFVATYVLVEQAQKSTTVTHGDVVTIAVCAAIIAICFVVPLINNVYAYFEIILGIKKDT